MCVSMYLCRRREARVVPRVDVGPKVDEQHASGGEADAAHLEESADQVGAAGRRESLPREVLGRQKLRNRLSVEIELDEQSF